MQLLKIEEENQKQRKLEEEQQKNSKPELQRASSAERIPLNSASRANPHQSSNPTLHPKLEKRNRNVIDHKIISYHFTDIYSSRHPSTLTICKNKARKYHVE